MKRIFSFILSGMIILQIMPVAMASNTEDDIGNEASTVRQMEALGRGIVAVRSSVGAFVSWRLLNTDPDGVGFNIYKSTDGGNSYTKLNDEVLTDGTNYMDKTYDATVETKYYVKLVVDGEELDESEAYTLKANTSIEPCYTIPLDGTDKSAIRDVWVGDLDGDGEYDFVVSRDGTANDTNSDNAEEDNSDTAQTNVSQKVEAYSRTGELLWKIDLGENSYNRNNIEPSASTIEVGMWDGVTVYDMDGDGKAEIMIRIASGVKFGDGTVWYEEEYNADEASGYYHQSIAVVNGETGKLITTAPVPDNHIAEGPKAAQLAIGCLDGVNPSLIAWFKNRNTDGSFNSYICAYKMNNGKLENEWTFDVKAEREKLTDPLAEGHQLRIADVDKDGKDEVLHIGYAIESDGKLKYQLPGVTHGDRFYVGQFTPDGDMSGYGIQQTSNLLEYGFNASTGKMLWENRLGDGTTGDVARGDCADIDPRNEGWECYSSYGLRNISKGEILYKSNPYPDIAIWWDGDYLRENINDYKLEKFDYATKSTKRLVTTTNYPLNDTSMATSNKRKLPMFVGDIIGDWREELVYLTADYDTLVVFTTDIPTTHRLCTLAQDPLYRNCMTIKGYVESHQVSYYLGSELGVDEGVYPVEEYTWDFSMIPQNYDPDSRGEYIKGSSEGVDVYFDGETCRTIKTGLDEKTLLKIVLTDSEEYVGCAGIKWHGQNGDTISKYMEYTPQVDGTLTVLYKPVFVSGNYGMSAIEGSKDTATAVKNTNGTLIVECKAGTTYYVAPTENNQIIGSVTYTPKPEVEFEKVDDKITVSETTDGSVADAFTYSMEVKNNVSVKGINVTVNNTTKSISTNISSGTVIFGVVIEYASGISKEYEPEFSPIY